MVCLFALISASVVLADADVASVMAGYLDGVTQLARVLDTMRIPDA